MSLNQLSKIELFPRIIIQPDWFLNLKPNFPSGDLWLEFKDGHSASSNSTKSFHGTCSIKAINDSKDELVEVSCSQQFRSLRIDQKQLLLEMKMDDNELIDRFQGPMTSFKTTVENISQDEMKPARSSKQTSSVHSNCFDISSGGVGLTGLSNGTITLWDINNGQIRRQIKGHIEDVYVSRFFPSDFALVSGGADMRIKICSFDSENDRVRDATLMGHHSWITDLLPLDSKHILSASNDGSTILWDVEQGQSIEKVVQLNENSINAISLTESSMVACAFQDGFVRFYDLNNRQANQMIDQIDIGSSVTALCYLSDSKQIVCANEQSIIGVFDTRQLNNKPIRIWKEQRAKINSLTTSFDRRSILGTTSDGSCFEYEQRQLENIINGLKFSVIDYTGADDSVVQGRMFSNKIYSLCRDNFIRIYHQLNDN